MVNLFKKIQTNIFRSNKVEKKNFVFQTILDLALLFKFILNWSISKIALYLGGIFLGLILSFPFFLGYNVFGDMSFVEIYTAFFSGVSINNFDLLFINIIYLYKSLGYIFVLLFDLDFLNIIFLIGGIFFIFSFFYPNFILIKLYNGYIEGEKKCFKNLDILNIRKYIKFLNLTLLNLLILLIPVIIFFILVGILAFFSGNLQELNNLVASGSNNYFSVISLIFLILCLFLLIYLVYRIIFSYFALAINYEEGNSIFSYIKISFIKTKSFKLFLKFMSLVVIFITFILPFKYIGFILSNNGTAINLYTIGFSLFAFIFLYGLFIMILTSFYKRELK